MNSGDAKRNVFEIRKERVIAHDGKGQIDFCRPFKGSDFASRLSFVDYVEIPSSCSIGQHRHGNDEEIYFIVSGNGRMTVEDETFDVREGDLILNRPGGRHGLENCSRDVLKVLVWEVSIS